MALAGRSARRGIAGVRWVVVGLVATLLILLIDASLHSSSPVPAQQLAAGDWVDRVLPVISSSNAEGQELAGIWAHGLTMAPSSVSSEMNQIAAGAAHNYQAVVALRPPSNLAGAAGLLEASLLARSEAASALRSAINQTLSSAAASSTSTSNPASATSTSTSSTSTTSTTTGSTSSTTSPSDPVLTSVQTAGNDLQVGDQAYQLFLRTLPKVGVSMPDSVWVTDNSDYQPSAAQVFLASLQSSAVASPVHQVRILSIMLDPPPVTTHGATLELPPATAITLTFVVANVGNQAEDNLTVTASISPSTPVSPSVRDFVNLSPGQAHTIVGLGPLTPPQGTPVTLTVTVTPQAGSALAPVTQTLVFSTPSPPTSSTTSPTTAPFAPTTQPSVGPPSTT